MANPDCSTEIPLFSKRNQNFLKKWLIPCNRKCIKYMEHFSYQVAKKLSKTTRVMAKEANFKMLSLAKDETI